MDLRLYFKKRKVEAESSASIKEGGDREDEENREEDDREEIEILEEDQEARQEIVEIQEEEDGDARQVETVETLEDGNRRKLKLWKKKMVLVLELERGRWADLIARNTWYNTIPNGGVSFLGLYQRKIIVKFSGCCVACV